MKNTNHELNNIMKKIKTKYHKKYNLENRDKINKQRKCKDCQLFYVTKKIIIYVHIVILIKLNDQKLKKKI